MLKNKIKFLLNRRDLLLSSAGMLFAQMANTQNQFSLDLDDPWDRLTALVKLRGSLDGRTVMWWMKGTRYGVVNDDIVDPLFGMLIGSFQQITKAENDKGYILNMLELGYLTDLDTGEILDTWRNPYNGKLCKVPEQRLGPYPVLLTPTGVVLPDIPAFGDIDLKTSLGPAIVNGDNVWIQDDSSVKVDSDHPMMGKHTYNEIVTYQGSLNEINDPNVPSASASINFQSVTSWREWHQAEGVGGHTTARAAGNKIYSTEDFPPEYQAAALERHKEIFSDPDAALAAPPAPMGDH
ncbi:MAG: DUF1838 family protein [Pseudomonadota bacterium]|nr:DUF1838 family protein [Pseudomonadota bacterium]